MLVNDDNGLRMPTVQARAELLLVAPTLELSLSGPVTQVIILADKAMDQTPVALRNISKSLQNSWMLLECSHTAVLIYALHYPLDPLVHSHGNGISLSFPEMARNSHHKIEKFPEIARNVLLISASQRGYSRARAGPEVPGVFFAAIILLGAPHLIRNKLEGITSI